MHCHRIKNKFGHWNMSEKQIVIKVGNDDAGNLPSLQQIIFNDPHEALRVAQELPFNDWVFSCECIID